MLTHCNNIILELQDRINKLISKPNQLATVSTMHMVNNQLIVLVIQSHKILLPPMLPSQVLVINNHLRTSRPVTTASTKSDPARNSMLSCLAWPSALKGLKNLIETSHT